MKKTIFKILNVAFLTMATLTLTNCGSDDPEIIVDPVDPIQPTSEVIARLDSGVMNGDLDQEYTLDPNKVYNLNNGFRVLDGGKLIIPAGTRIQAINGGTDVYLAVLKGGMIDVQGTESNPVFMSSAAGNAGDWAGLTICGNASTTSGADATAEIGGFKYGGNDDADSSGSIKYLVIKGSGAQINDNSQYNGLSLYAVGSETTIDNVAIINGNDDGIEFFGGTVSVTNLYLENNMDDSIDWTEGWNGMITGAYILNTEAGFSTVFEGDKENKNPKFKNITAVSTVGGTALQFKAQSGGTITSLSLSGYDVELDMKDGGDVANVIFKDGLTPQATTDPAVDGKYFYSLSTTATPAITKDDFAWVNSSASISTSILQGTLSSELTLDASVNYKLNSSYIVKDGGKLIIPAGTKITARNGGTGVYIAVLKGGKIEIKGEASNPVVISSETAKPGDWGGLTICGKATTTAGVDAEAEIGGFIYGGTTDNDNSGSINYLVLKGTGAQINPESQYNGLSLYAVGSGTTISNVAVLNGSDDGVEFFGGTVSASNLYLENLLDDAIDWTEGWNGTVTNAYIKHTVADFSTALEGDKENKNPKFVNLTAVSTTGGTALQFKKTSGATITNLYLSGYDKNIDMKDNGPLSNVKIDGADADTNATYMTGTQVDVSTWTWKSAGL